MFKLATLGLASIMAMSQLSAVHKPVQGRNLKGNLSRHHSSSSSSDSSSASAHLDHIGAYTENLGLDVDFDPNDLLSVLEPVFDTDPPASAFRFDTNEPGSSHSIIHPAPGDDYTRFHVSESGSYLITWTFTIGCLDVSEGEGCLNGAFVQLYDAANDVPLHPNPMQFVDTENFEMLIDSEVVSGQQIIKLDKGTEIQLRLIPAAFDFGALWIANPSFTMTRVDKK